MNEYLTNNPEFFNKTYQMYIYTRNSNKKHSLSPLRLINKTEKILPISKEKFHNEIQISINEGKLRFLRLIKAIPNNLWVLQNPKDIEAVFDKVIDLKIPFNLLDVAYGETLEFVFVNARMGVNEVFIPNEMLLNIKRD